MTHRVYKPWCRSSHISKVWTARKRAGCGILSGLVNRRTFFGMVGGANTRCQDIIKHWAQFPKPVINYSGDIECECAQKHCLGITQAKTWSEGLYTALLYLAHQPTEGKPSCHFSRHRLTPTQIWTWTPLVHCIDIHVQSDHAPEIHPDKSVKHVLNSQIYTYL